MPIKMNNARIDRLLMQLNEQMDKELLDHIGLELNRRLTNKRAEGRGGWFRMETHELAALLCEILEKQGEHMFLDCIAVFSFMQGRECDPKAVGEQLSAWLGRNWSCKESAKSETGAQSIAQCDKPTVMDAVKQIPDGAKCIVYRVGEDPLDTIWDAVATKFVVVGCGGRVRFTPMEVSGYHIVEEVEPNYEDLIKSLGLENLNDYIIRTISDKAFRNHEYRWCAATQIFTNVCSKDDKVHISVIENAQLAPQVKAAEPEEVELEPRNLGVYNLRIDGAACLNQYKYFAKTGNFREVDHNNRLIDGGQAYQYGDDRVEWGEV